MKNFCPDCKYFKKYTDKDPDHDRCMHKDNRFFASTRISHRGAVADTEGFHGFCSSHNSDGKCNKWEGLNKTTDPEKPVCPNNITVSEAGGTWLNWFLGRKKK